MAHTESIPISPTLRTFYDPCLLCRCVVVVVVSLLLSPILLVVISNHDEPRAAQFFGSWWRADATALVMFTMPGMKFYYMWDYYGFANRLDVHLRYKEKVFHVAVVVVVVVVVLLLFVVL